MKKTDETNPSKNTGANPSTAIPSSAPSGSDSKEPMTESISIFILKANPNSLVQAESFLRNRKWIVGSSTNLREALAYIIQKQPQYVMITSDHPNKKVRILPRMLVQAFPVRIIGFAEKTSNLSSKALQEMGLEYTLYPPVSGPAVERMVLKIRKDEETRNSQASETSLKINRGENPDEMITFKGEARSSGDMKASFEQARAALSQMLSTPEGQDDDASGVIIASSANASQNSGPSFLKGQNQDGSGYFQPPQPEGSFKEGSSDWGSQSPQAKSGRESQGDAKSHSSATGSTPGNGTSNASGSFAGGSSIAGGSQAAGSSGGFAGFGGVGASPNSSPSSSDSNTNTEGKEGFRRNQSGTPIMESEYKPKSPQRDYRFSSSEDARAVKKDSIIVRGTEQALEESVNVGDKHKPDVIEKSSNVACITIQSARFSGYLVCALGKDRKIDKSFIDVVQKRLFSFLKSNGEKIKEDDTMDLKIQEVDFTDWALEQAEFLKRSIHEGDEIAMAFFPSSNMEVELSNSASQKMVKMDLKELKEDTALEFDLYIFMPENNKYILYTPKGMPFYGHQKGRLHAKGITHMHLRKDSAHSVKKYKAQNFLNEKIASYKAAQKS